MRYVVFFTVNVLILAPASAEIIQNRRPRGDKNELEQPDFKSKTLDPSLASKLANMRVGTFNRLRRQTETDIKKEADSAQINSAVAAIQAEEAKESALNAFEENEKIEKFIDKGGENLVKASSSSSSNIHSSNSQQPSSTSGRENSHSEYEEGYEDDDDDDEAEETIVEDEVVTVKTEIIKKGKDHKQSSSKESNETGLGISTPPTGPSVCQGLLDLKRMTDDFRERLQALIEREEQVVEKLEQYASKQSSKKEVSSSSDAQPSRACVFIEENVKANIDSSSHAKDSRPNQRVKAGDSEGKVHVYTSARTLPSQGQHAEDSTRRAPQRQGPIPILEGRIVAPHGGHQSNPSLSNDDDHSKLFSRSHRFKVVRSSQDSEAKNDHEEDIKLQKIIWLKPGSQTNDGEERVEEGDPVKYENAVKKIIDEGYDVLIIPISRKFTSAKDVATTFVDAMRGMRTRRYSNKRRFKMTIRKV